MKNQSGIYEIFNTVNGKRYIGSARSFTARWKKHRLDLLYGKHHSPFLQHSYNKYGADSFQYRILILCAEKDLLMYEQRFLDAMKPEYNSCGTAGCRRGVKLTPEQCAAISERTKRMWAENREMMLARSGQAWKYNKNGHTVETKARISEKKKGVPQPPGAAEKSAASRRGIPRLPEVIEKIKAAQIGVPKPRPSEAVRAKLREAQRLRRLREGCTLHPEIKSVSRYVRIGEQAPEKKPRKHSPETIAKLCIAAQAREAKRRAATC